MVTLACPPVTAATGGAITYTGTVPNSGNVTLNNVTVVNDQPAPNTVVFTVASLAPGVTATFTAVTTAPLNACSVRATVTATGTDNCTSAPVSNSASVTCTLLTSPGILVTKECPATPTVPGQMLVFSGTVRNTGNITLNNIVVVNNQPALNTSVFTVATLAPGEVASFTGGYLAPLNCSVADTLSARPRAPAGSPSPARPPRPVPS